MESKVDTQTTEAGKRPGSPLAEDEVTKASRPLPESEVPSTNPDFHESGDMTNMRIRLEQALHRLSPDIRNALLLQAVHHYKEVRKLRDDLLLQVAQLDPPFADLVFRKAGEEATHGEGS